MGPVLFIDTAGRDDKGALGELRIQRTRRVFDRTDLGLVVVAAGDWSDFEDELLSELEGQKIPAVVVFNKSDLGSPSKRLIESLKEKKIPFVKTNALIGRGAQDLREALIASAPDDFIN